MDSLNIFSTLDFGYEIEHKKHLDIEKTEVLACTDSSEHFSYEVKPKRKRKKSEKKQTQKDKSVEVSTEIGVNVGTDIQTLGINTDNLGLKVKPKKDGLGVIEITEVQTSNEVLSVVQKNEQEKIKQEKQRIQKADKEFPYIRRELLTNAEFVFYRYMKDHLCQSNRIEIFPKIRLADLADVDRKITNDDKYLWKITNKHVDFVICRADTLKIICVVELDDFMHETQKAKEKDMFVMQVLYEVGIRTVRVRNKVDYLEPKDIALIDDYINTELAPKCPYCGYQMVPKKCMQGPNRGHRFYGCTNYADNCRVTINIDQDGEKLP